MNQNALNFLNQTKVPVKVINRKQISTKYGGNHTTNHEFPEYVLIVSLVQCGTVLDLQYFANGFINQAYISIDFKFGKLPKSVIKELLSEYQVYAIFEKRLSYPWHIGSDPEIFVENENGVNIPAFKFLGSKEKPTKINDSQNLFWDGFQAEFTTRPNSCLAYHVDSIQSGLKNTLEYAKKFNPNAKLSLNTVIDISKETLVAALPEHVAFGCMPSFNVYGLKGLELPGIDVTFRSAGGHIHFGCGKLTEQEVINVVKALDAIIGVACVSLFEGLDDPRRRQMYGMAGEYRLPKHGLEYRALSNAWLCHPLITNIVFDLARQAFMLGKEGLNSFWIADEKDVIDTIQFCDVKKARKILNRNKETLAILLSNVYTGAKPMVIQKVFMNGVRSAVAHPEAIAENWNIVGKTTWITHCNGMNKNVVTGASTLYRKKKVA